MKKVTIGIIGLGYVGLPLAVEFGKIDQVVGFDVKQERIEVLKRGQDVTREVDPENLRKAKGLELASDPEALRKCSIYIVTVPTPVDSHKKPDLRPLLEASKTVGRVLKKGDLVIYESTVFPGCTEEECVPVLEQESGLVFNRDFFCGYSPERINPGDKEHTLTRIKKVTSGSTPEAARKVDELYRCIITAGTYPVSSIRVAEAAKVIENAQRDINIAFMNELALIFNKMGIDTLEVLEAAGTKWNFLPFRPGLVGGHCIGVDPYYLTYKAESLGYNPQVILAGRRINDGMGAYVASRVIKLMIRKGIKVAGSRVLVMGITFKENCQDIRNSKVVDIIRELKEYGCEVEIYDPHANEEEVRKEYGLELIHETVSFQAYDSVILAVAHRDFSELDIKKKANGHTVIFDIKGILEKRAVTERL